MKFIDSTQLIIRAGKGGDGIVSFRSAKGRPKLGPDGGDGGHGGSVFLVGKNQLNTLSALRYKALYQAENGQKGGAKGCRGRTGEDLLIPVPLGTIAYDDETGVKLGELVEDGQQLVVAKGGLRGLGNIHWLSSTHQQPHEFKPGAKGEERLVRLELKLLADVGLAGFPNAGKSTLLSRISAARPKIADYPFTTLVPNLGVVDLEHSDGLWGASFVVADVPGLIEGASEGKGLGLNFLRHLERTSVLVYVIDSYDQEQQPEDALNILQSELRGFGDDLTQKRSLVALNKVELLPDEECEALRARLVDLGYEVITISAAEGRGLDTLKRRLYQIVQEEKKRQEELSRQKAAELSAEVRAEQWRRYDPKEGLVRTNGPSEPHASL